MDYLQYKNYEKISISIRIQQSVLNLVINGLPSIQEATEKLKARKQYAEF